MTRRPVGIGTDGHRYAPQSAAADISMHRFLRAQGATDAMIELAYDINTRCGTGSHDVSALMMAFVEAFTRDGRRSTAGSISAANRPPGPPVA